MNGIWHIALAWARQYRWRLILVGSAIALATALVVVAISGNRAIATQTSTFVRQSVGHFDLIIKPARAIEPLLGNDVINQLRADERLQQVELVDVVQVEVLDSRDATYYDTFPAPCFATDRAEAIAGLADGRWLGADAETEAVLSGALARRWQVQIGDQLQIESRGGSFKLELVGITREQLAIASASGLFVRPATAVRLAGGSRMSQQAFVAMTEEADEDAVLEHWRQRAAAATPAAKLVDLGALEDELGLTKAVKNFKRMGLAGAVIAIVAAAFLVGSALAIGVRERSRQLALLRAVGMTRGQIAGAVIGEALALAIAGSAAGVVLGTLLLFLLAAWQPELFPAGAWPDPIGVVAGIAAALGTALVAGARPAWQATRARPLDAVGLMAQDSSRRPWRGQLPIALILLAVAAAIRWATPVDDSGFYLVTFLLCLLGGLAAGTRPLLLAVTHLLGPPLARLARVPADLLGRRSADRAGVVGTVWTLTTGLGLYVAIQAWGSTMVAPFLPSAALPDMVVSVLPAGLPPAGVQQVQELPQIRDGRALPLAVEQTLLGPDLLTDAAFAGSSGTVLLLAAEPARAYDGDDPMLPLDYVDGDAEVVIDRLAAEGGCVLPESFARQAGLTRGDRLVLTHPGDPSTTLDLPVVAIANLPGWHWVTKMSGMRSLGSRPEAPVFIALATAQAAGFGTVKHLYCDVAAATTRQELRQEVMAIAQSHAGRFDDPRFGPTTAANQYVKLTDTRDIAHRMQTQADRVVWLLAAVPLIALAVAALGVAHTMLADLRQRRWELGVLRSIGLEAEQLRRLVLVEALLFGATAAVLSLTFGLAAAEAGLAISVTATGAAGAVPPLNIPWLALIVGILATAAIILAAAWQPARRTARREPLELLQLGRAGQ